MLLKWIETPYLKINHCPIPAASPQSTTDRFSCDQYSFITTISRDLIIIKDFFAFYHPRDGAVRNIKTWVNDGWRRYAWTVQALNTGSDIMCSIKRILNCHHTWGHHSALIVRNVYPTPVFQCGAWGVLFSCQRSQSQEVLLHLLLTNFVSLASQTLSAEQLGLISPQSNRKCN